MTTRKPIVIGETYIFDVLNESNKATNTTLVTVVKKAKKRNWYTVLSVNNGDIFNCPDELLTPYVNPEKASVVRCQYGTTEFNIGDLMSIESIPIMIRAFFDILTKFKNRENEEQFIEYLEGMIKTFEQDTNLEKVEFIQNEIMTGLINKIKKYVYISTYKYILQDLSKKNNTAIDSFNSKFKSLISEYKSNKIEISNFIQKAMEILSNYFPEDMLVPNDKDELYNLSDVETLKSGVYNIFSQDKDAIVFLISKTKKSKHNIVLSLYDYTNNEEISKCIDMMINDLYDIDENGNYYRDYTIATIAINSDNKGEDYNDAKTTD